MEARFFCELPLQRGREIQLPAGAARHVQVLRLQPGAPVLLFNGQGGQWRAEITRIGRSEVDARIGEHEAVERELPRRICIALGMPANERMDTLIEKATELGVAEIQPLQCERSVLRLAGERALRKQAHWRAIAVAACEQCGRNRVPEIATPQSLRDWLAGQADAQGQTLRILFSPDAEAALSAPDCASARELVLLSGPEGGLSAAEQALARDAGFIPRHLGPRVLRADTAPLAALAWMGLL